MREDALDYLTELAIQSQQEWADSNSEVDLEQQKQEAIALCQRKIDAAVNLYGDGRITRRRALARPVGEVVSTGTHGILAVAAGNRRAKTGAVSADHGF